LAAASVWIDVPYIHQEKEGCGAASIAMVMQYWGREKGVKFARSADPHEIQRALYSKEAGGILASDMKKYLEQAGLKTFAFKGEWADLQEHISQGRPLIVCLQSPGWRSLLHYVVVAGIDAQKNSLLLNDPAQRKLLPMDRAQFEKEWKKSGNWTLLALPASSE
jgi:ABC-type bacteriocin/lantibiotic exporter with double-glycine peptidase domain